eukprot:243625-Amphidinium_carterae.1
MAWQSKEKAEHWAGRGCCSGTGTVPPELASAEEAEQENDGNPVDETLATTKGDLGLDDEQPDSEPKPVTQAQRLLAFRLMCGAKSPTQQDRQVL